MDFIHYIAMGISMAAVVGPFNIELINRGIRGGFYPVLFLAFGGITANISFFFIIYFGWSEWMQNQDIESVFFTIGALILLYLGYMSVTSRFVNNKIAPSFLSSFSTGFLLGFANPINFMAWYSSFSQASHTLFVENPPITIFIYSFFIMIGVFIWMMNLSLAVSFIRERISDPYRKILTLITGIMLLWFCSEYLRRIAEMTLNW
ncbi:LysE family translocator [Bacillus litorisediminis]|uniref:LysE family translocator n=1 Tax=Bacillus litorisediminis TaxID=2922713 RepID=UPI001FABDB96|nr:LysE family transporter [Bacillus litorisediminis]